MSRLASERGKCVQLNEIAGRLEGVRQVHRDEIQALCPGHADKKASLNIKEKNGKLLVSCYAGCKTEDIVKSMGLSLSDLFLESRQVTLPKIVATYDYQDETGKLLFQTIRYEPKDFKQRHKNGNGEWLWNLQGVRRVLYRLPELIDSDPAPVYLVEGEKDADALWKFGYVATTSPCGANSWKQEYADSLRGRKVIIIPDNDTAGKAYAREVANSLEGKAEEVRVILLPDKDVSQWLQMGHNVKELHALEEDIDVLFQSDKPFYRKRDDCIVWDKHISKELFLTFKAEKVSEERTGIHARITILANRTALSWTYLNIERSEDRTRLSNAAHGGIKKEQTKEYTKDNLRHDLDAFCLGLWQFYASVDMPEELEGDDTETPIRFLLKPYILEGGGTILFAPPGRGKSFSGLLWGVSVDAGVNTYWPTTRVPVLFINLERSKESYARRLGRVNKVLGLPTNRKAFVINARGKTLSAVAPSCRKFIKDHGVKMIVLDSISRAGYGDLNENQSMNRMVDGLSALCDSWLALGHTSRADETHSYGSIMQDAGADVCIQLASQVKDGVLGVGWETTKQNDIPKIPQSIWAFEFEELGLKSIRKAHKGEFEEIEGKKNMGMLDTVKEYLLNEGDASASQLEKELGYSRSKISLLLQDKKQFVQTRQVGHSQYYGLKSDMTY